MKELNNKIDQWFIDRGLHNADPTKQMLKLFEELGELASAMAKDQSEEIRDSLGDAYVVLRGIALQLDLDFTECVALAYNEIKDRRGELRDGIWVKEEDL